MDKQEESERRQEIADSLLRVGLAIQVAAVEFERNEIMESSTLIALDTLMERLQGSYVELKQFKRDRG